MFDVSNKLVGIYKTYDITKVITISSDRAKMHVMK